MIIFERFKAVWGVLLAAALAAIPIMIQFTPAAVYTGLRPWMTGLSIIAVVLAAYSLLAIVYSIGVRRGASIPSSEEAVAPQAGPPDRSIDELIYAARTATSALLENGELRYDAVRREIVRLERQHRAWHDHVRHQARENFLEEARRAVQSRMLQTSWMVGPGAHYGNFPEDQREQFHAELKQRRDALIMTLEALRPLARDDGSGPELIE